MNPTDFRDPLRFAALLWPRITFYDKQREIIRSVEENPETFVVGCNMSGVWPRGVRR